MTPQRPPPLGMSRRWSLLLLLALLLPQALRADDDFRVESVAIRTEGDMLVMDAQLDYGFSEVAVEALDNGVPLTLEVHIQLRPADAWVWDSSLVDQRLRYVIRYKPLSERYLVSRLPGDGGRSYVTRDAAVAALGDLRDLQLTATDRLEQGRDYEIHLQAHLDIEELPLPLKPMAYLLPSWKLSTGWTKWPLER
jgi:hypothetical protein